MVLKNRRLVLGILIMTLIFGFLSIISMFNLYDDVDSDNKPVDKNHYSKLLENEFDIEITSENDFEIINSINYEMLVEPVKYQSYVKPCFDFMIVDDGIIITNSLSKDFYEYGLTSGMKIVSIDGISLMGKTYFEILELIYSETLEVTKVFELNDGRKINHQYKIYKTYENRLEYIEEDNTLYVYNLDKISIRAIYDVYEEHPDLILDLSKATINKYESIKNFVSLFYRGENALFIKPENVYTSKYGFKIDNLKIVLNNNTDLGINFALTTIQKLNANIKIVANASDEEGLFLTTTHFNSVKVLENASYKVYIRNEVLQGKGFTAGDLV